jgi:D-alanine-D-alanine ligase
LVFNVAEGVSGRSREAQVPCVLEAFGVGYTFSDPLVCAATLDKAVAKRLVHAAGVPTPRFHVVRKSADSRSCSLEYPLFAKPLAEGTGKGVTDRSRIDSPRELVSVCGDLLNRFGQPVLVEEYLPGREFTVAVLGNGSSARALGGMEIEILSRRDGGIYSQESKEKCEELVRYSAVLPGPLRSELEDLALRSYVALECRDAARVDIRCDRNGRPCFMEVNPLPGLHPTHSDLPMIATNEGVTYAELIGTIIANALGRLEQGDSAARRERCSDPV